MLIDGEVSEADLALAARLTARFSKGRDATTVTVTATDRNGRSQVLSVRPMASGDVPQNWYV